MSLIITPLTIDQAPIPMRVAVHEVLSSPFNKGMVLLSLEKSTYEDNVPSYFAHLADSDKGVHLHFTERYGVIKQEMSIAVMKHILSFVDRRVAV